MCPEALISFLKFNFFLKVFAIEKGLPSLNERKLNWIKLKYSTSSVISSKDSSELS